MPLLHSLLLSLLLWWQTSPSFTTTTTTFVVGAFQSTSSWSTASCRRRRWPSTSITAATHPNTISVKLDLSPTNIIDAEVISPDDDNDSDNSAAASTSSPSNNLIEYSQNLDPDWKKMPIAFCDTQSNTYIDCNLAFYVKDPTTLVGEDMEEEYALGVPCEIPIVVALELPDDDASSNLVGATTSTAAENDQMSAKKVVNLSRVIPINPDDSNHSEHGLPNNTNNIISMQDEEKEEIFQLAARALMEEFGPSIRLKRTPRVLTMEGNLDEVLGGDWRRVLWGDGTGSRKGGSKSDDDDEKMSLDSMLHLYDDNDDDDDDDAKEDDGDEDFFDKIMRRDLGDDYETLVDDEDRDIDDDILKLFDDSPDMFDDDLNELMDKVKDITAEVDDDVAEEVDNGDSGYDALIRRLQPSAALRLLNFIGPDGREYTILRPLRPILLVGKEDPDDYTRRILLSEEERARVLPRLEGACREGLEDILSGYNFAG